MDYQERTIAVIMRDIVERNQGLSSEVLYDFELHIKMAYGVAFNDGISARSSRREIQQLDTEYEEVVDEFSSAAHASRRTKIERANIINVCNRKRGLRTAGGYKWRWK